MLNDLQVIIDVTDWGTIDKDDVVLRRALVAHMARAMIYALPDVTTDYGVKVLVDLVVKPEYRPEE